MTTLIHYLDTSALIKLLLWPDIREAGSTILSEFINNHKCFYTLDLCVGEALNVLKRMCFDKKKNRRVLNCDGYLICIERLRTMTKPSHSLHVKKINLSDDLRSLEAFKLVKQFKIDFVDAWIVLSARAHRPFHPEQNLLITGESKMAKAAKEINMPVWRCNKDTSLPPG